MIWLAEAESGEWEDHSHWVIGVFSSADLAKKAIEKFCKERYEYWMEEIIEIEPTNWQEVLKQVQSEHTAEIYKRMANDQLLVGEWEEKDGIWNNKTAGGVYYIIREVEIDGAA